MLTENGLSLDPEAVRQVLESADLITIGFTTFPERLLIDTRTVPDEGPLVAIVAPVGSVQERYLWLGQHRGKFGAPKGFSFFVWPQSVRGMIERHVLEPVRLRLRATSSDGEEMLDRALERLRELDAAATENAIRGGEGWVTVWQAQGTRS
ncbi:MAG: hypothetical protein ACM3S1_01425 [Hyphomicrobiales bacterium]